MSAAAHVLHRALAVPVGAAALAAAAPLAAQQRDFSAVEIEVLPVQEQVYMIVGTGGNVTMQVGDDGVMLVDSQYAELGERILTAIRGVTDKPIKYLINTHVHGDHVGGNAYFFEHSGLPDYAGPTTGVTNASYDMKIVAHENVVLRMTRPEPEGMPAELWPTDTYFVDDKEIYFNGEGVRLTHQPAAHTDGDTIVHFRDSDVISAGDVFVTTSYPVIDRDRGGSIDGIIDGLNYLLHTIIPRSHAEGGTLVIPGHGRISDEADVVEYRDMVVIVRERIQRMVDEGMSLRQVQAARPTLDYDPRYGSESGFWTTEQFVEAIYRESSGD